MLIFHCNNRQFPKWYSPKYIALYQKKRVSVFARILTLELGKRTNSKLEGAFVITKTSKDNIGTQNLVYNKPPLTTSRIKHIGINTMGLDKNPAK